MRSSVVFYLNGQRQVAGPAEARMMLADFLRYRRGLTGTKIVCAEGDCGACTVLRLGPAMLKGESQYVSINSCITTVAQMDGSSLVTVEALRSQARELSPVQTAMVAAHGSQCGFCTPGFVMALAAKVEAKKNSGDPSGITWQEAKNALTGNLCRCTGYQPILDAACAIDIGACESLRTRYHSPKQARDLRQVCAEAVTLEDKDFSFFAPTNWKELATYAKRRRGWQLLAAGTDLGVVHNKRKARMRHLVSLHLIKELYQIRSMPGRRVLVGARVTLTQLRHWLQDRIPEFSSFLDLFASPQIKNVATLVGNVGNASPIADTPPFLLAMDAQLLLRSASGDTRVVALEKFYRGYRKTAMRPGEIIAAIEWQLPSAHEQLKLYKVSQRKDLDISTVNAAFRLLWQDGQRKKLRAARVVLGGIAAIPCRLPDVEKKLCQGGWHFESRNELLSCLQAAIQPISDLRGSAEHRRLLAENLLVRFLNEELPL